MQQPAKETHLIKLPTQRSGCMGIFMKEINSGKVRSRKKKISLKISNLTRESEYGNYKKCGWIQSPYLKDKSPQFMLNRDTTNTVLIRQAQIKVSTGYGNNA